MHLHQLTNKQVQLNKWTVSTRYHLLVSISCTSSKQQSAAGKWKGICILHWHIQLVIEMVMQRDGKITWDLTIFNPQLN